MAGKTEWLPLSVVSVCGQIGDCVTTAGRRPQTLGFAYRSLSVYIARTLGLMGGTNTCQSDGRTRWESEGAAANLAPVIVTYLMIKSYLNFQLVLQSGPRLWRTEPGFHLSQSNVSG